MRTSLSVALFLGVAACGGGGGGGTGVMIDAPSNIPAMITISGVASQRDLSGTTPLSGVLVAAFKNSDEANAITSITTGADGKYSLVITTGGQPLDGFVKATISMYMDTYLYPPAPVSADFSGASINLLKPATFSLLSDTLCRATQDSSMGAIALEVLDGATTAAMPIAGATVSSSPAAAKECYDASGAPSSTATMTDTDGVAYMFNITGQATLSASKSGTTFKSHPVNAHAGALTTTLITP
jgi:hypothetical protein